MLYKEKNDIINWLDKYGVDNYTLRPDDNYGYVVDVAGSVYLGNKNLTELSVKFGVIKVHFLCHDNQLTSLMGSPDAVGDFVANGNQLTSLEGSPRHVARSFHCQHNQLNSLKGMPESVLDGFYCSQNPQLGEFQDINDFKVIKAYFLAQQLSQSLEEKNVIRKIKI